MPFVAKAKTMATGISTIMVSSFSINIFSIAGSSNHAIDAVLPATPKDNKRESTILGK